MPVGDGAGANDNKTKVLNGDTIAGQIAAFMDNLHMSYKEVYEELPYLQLVLMNADKPVVVSADEVGQEVKKMSGKELMKLKGG